MTEHPLKGAVEVLPQRLYFIVLRAPPRANASSHTTRSAHYFSIDDELVYWNFFLDFGPLNLGQLYRFSALLNSKMTDSRLSKKIIYFFCGSEGTKRANAAVLICAWQILYMGRTPDEAFEEFRGAAFPAFHDASPCVCTYKLGVLDVLRGLAKAKLYNFFNFDTFDVQEYEFFEQVENGDLNWIIDNKILAFAGPHYTNALSKEGYRTLTPDDYIPYYKSKNVDLVIRLNKKYYDEQKFIDAGINHFEQYYLDGSVPPKKILKKILREMDRCDGAMAIHCKAGLGRTGTCIGAWMMKHYNFTAAEAIGWMRICRPGSVIGPQQQFMVEIEQEMWHEGDLVKNTPSRGLSAPSEDDAEDEHAPRSLRNKKDERIVGRVGQGDALRARRMVSTARN